MADAAVAQMRRQSSCRVLCLCHCLNHGVAGALKDTGSQLIMICQGQDLCTLTMLDPLVLFVRLDGLLEELESSVKVACSSQLGQIHRRRRAYTCIVIRVDQLFLETRHARSF